MEVILVMMGYLIYETCATFLLRDHYARIEILRTVYFGLTSCLYDAEIKKVRGIHDVINTRRWKHM